MADRKEYIKQYHIKYRERIEGNHKIWIENNREEIRKCDREYYKNNTKQVNEKNKRWAGKNPLKMNGYKRKWDRNNPEKKREINRFYRMNNSGKVREWDRDRRKTNLKANINDRLSTAIRFSLKGNKAGRKWEKLVGYTVNDLIKRLKKTIPEGYAWQDFLDGKLHIDHIIPISAFNYSKPEHADFRRCWALSNLQLLPAKENLRKSNKLTKPFQPALKI